MAEHNVLGSKGEDVAAEFLERQGFRILHRNWRLRHKEVDIIAEDGAQLVFVEVKTRTRRMDAGDVISDFKINALREAAEGFLEKYSRTDEIRFDVILLTPQRDGYSVEHIRDAFH